MAADIEFDWDYQNTKHLAAHRVLPTEFEELLRNNPLDVDYEMIDGEERYRSVGVTDKGRILSTSWTVRNGIIRAITAFPASVSDKKMFWRDTK